LAQELKYLTRLGRETVEEELWGYLRLEEGWDGSGSVAPSEHAVKNAISFLHRFPDTMMEPTPMVAADGEVGLYWRHKGAYVEIDFAADGMMFGYGRDLDGKEVFIDDVFADSHEEVESAIAAVSRILAEFPLEDAQRCRS
jgi:hypothetical protein